MSLWIESKTKWMTESVQKELSGKRAGAEQSLRVLSPPSIPQRQRKISGRGLSPLCH